MSNDQDDTRTTGPATSVKQTSEYQATAHAVANAVEASRAVKDVDSDDALGVASEALARVAKVKRRGDATRKQLTEPHREATNAINGAFKELLSPLDGAEKALRQRVAEFHSRREAAARAEQKRQAELAARRQREEDKRAAAEHRPAVEHQAAVVATPPAAVATTTGSVGTRKVWKHEVVSVWEVPPEFLTVDEAKVRQAIRDGRREIPGIRIYEDVTTVVR